MTPYLYHINNRRMNTKDVILVAGIAICFLAAHVVFAQQEGTVIYSTKVNMHRTIPPERAEMKDMLPEFNTFKTKLVFRGQESYFSPVEEEVEDEFGDSSAPVQVRLRRPQSEYYHNFASQQRIAVREFFGKYFRIEDTLRTLPWKLVNDSKSIQGYSCKKATLVDADKKQSVTAWYAEKLPPYLGPEEFTGLPGTILELDVNDGERVTTALSLSLAKLEKGDLAIPTKGQKSTEEGFRKMTEEHRKKMGGNRMIIRN
jgi:GLPGLI family protein